MFKSWLPGNMIVRAASSGATRQCVEEFGPFARAPGVRHIAADDDVVERVSRMDGRETGQHAIETPIATRTGATALDAEAISFADHVKVRQMRNAPAAASGWRGIECGEIEGLMHAGIGNTPRQRCEGEIARHQHDGICKRRHDEAMQQDHVVPVANPARGRPDQNRDQCRACAQHDAGAERIRATQPRPSGRVEILARHPFRQMAQRFAAERVDGLDSECVERPEIGSRRSETAAAIRSTPAR